MDGNREELITALAARWLAFFAITLLLVYSGQIVLLAGLILSASDPVDYIRDNW